MHSTPGRDDPQKPTVTELDAVIVGAGFAGLYTLHRLLSLGLSVRVYERGSGIGGTWFWNRYPGARCDVESLDYSYSFSPQLQQEWRWPHRYSVQSDILGYINHVADRFDLRRHIHLNTRVVSQVFDDHTAKWTVTTNTGETVRARFCIMATGNLSVRKLPDIAGIEKIAAAARNWYYSADWPTAGVDFTGKRVALIGTGATGVQLTPKLAEQAKHLYVFQRTPNFSVPARNIPIDDAADRAHKATYDQRRVQARATSFGMGGTTPPTKSALQATPEEREKLYEARWQQGGSINFLSAYTDLLTNLEANKTAADFVRRKIRETVHDPAVAALLSPTDHPIGSKRLCLDTDYYETFNRPNVTLVDAKTHPIVEITTDAVRTRDGKRYEVDAVVFATGFDAITGALLSIDIRGRGGLPLRTQWVDGPKTYLGLMVSGFPNLFIITGPGSPSVKSNMVTSIEQHADFIADAIGYLDKHQMSQIEAEVHAEQAWVQHVNEIADATLYPLADTWYNGANVPGKPRVFMPYVGGIPAYWKKCREVVANGYEGFSLKDSSAPSAVASAARGPAR